MRSEKRRKIVLVGAGSAVFTKGLLLDILERREERWHVALVDTDPRVLEIIRCVCRKMIEQKGSDTLLSASTDRCQVFPEADYVVSTIGVGGRRAWEQDVFIPRKYGIYQPVGDTVGPGGISRAMRMIPQLIDIANDVKKLCPDAVFINYANPMTMNCMAVRRVTGVPVIGLCHGVKNGIRRVANFLGVPCEEIQFTACGLNHMVFCSQMRRNGQDLFPEFVDKLDAVKWEGRSIGPLTEDFVRRNHTYVVSDDRHFSEFVPSVMAFDQYFGRTLGVDAFSFEGTIQEGDEEFALYERYAEEDGPLPEEFFAREEGEHEQLMDIIAAMYEDKPTIFYANLPNKGAVSCLPADTVVDRPAVFSGSGVMPVQLPDFPAYLLPPLMRYASIYEVAVTAALTGDRKLLECAMEEATYSVDHAAIHSMTEELLAAHREYLPQFK